MKKKIIRVLAVLILIGISFGFYYLYVRLPIVNGYAAKNLCSCIFVAGREQADVEAHDLDFSLVKYASNHIDYDNQSVSSSFLGMRTQTAYYNEKTGCSLVNGEARFSPKDFDKTPYSLSTDSSLFNQADFSGNINLEKLNAAINDEFQEKEGENTRNTRAVVVLYKGKIVGEKYAEGFNENSIQLGWSMSKSIMSTLVGILVQQGKIATNEIAPVPEWKNDDRQYITWNHLLQMTSGLEWVEDYGSISDVTKMLYTDNDMYSFAINHELEFQPGEAFKYSSGTSNILSGMIKTVLGNEQDYLDFPYKYLFNKLGMSSMQLETDATGTYVGSSYSWATARDWAKYGQLYLNNGKWNGEQIFPKDWAAYTATSSEASEGIYGAQFWLQNEEEFPNVPKDMYFADGFQGQRVFIIPSKELVVVRLGISNRGPISYNELLKDLCEAVE